MNKACIFFKISDLTMHLPRNYKRYPEITAEKNLVFDERYGKYTRADVFFKKKEQGKYPVLVNVHGGGFVKGDKRHRRAISCYFAQNGWFVLNINHRLSPPYIFPAGIEDTINAINYLEEIKEKYNLDLDRIVISGDSAGAYYAAAAVVASKNEEYRKALRLPECRLNAAAFLGFCGPYELENLLSRKSPLNVARNVADAMVGYKIKPDLSNLKDFPDYPYLNLIPYINADFPESYLVISEKDSFCGGQGEMLAAKLSELDVKHHCYLANGKGEVHCFHLFPWKENTKRCLSAVSLWAKKFTE